MPIYQVQNGEEDVSLKKQPFDSEGEMHDYVENHPSLLGGEIEIVERESPVSMNGRKGRMDLLALDKESKQILVVELKDKEIDERVLPQLLRYGSWVKKNPNSIKYKILKSMDVDQEDIDYQNIQLVVVAPNIKRSLADISKYIEAFDFSLKEFNRMIDRETGKEFILVDDILPSFDEPPKLSTKYDMDWYEKKLRDNNFRQLKQILSSVDEMIEEEGWNLGQKFIKNSIRYQRSGNNAIKVDPRKRDEHMIKFRLGSDFDPNQLSEEKQEIAKELEPDSYNDLYWKTRVDENDIEEFKKYKPLIEISHGNIEK